MSTLKLKGPSISFGLTCFLLFTFLGLVNVAVIKPLLANDFLCHKIGNTTYISDFALFFRCAKMLASPDASKIYDIASQLRWTNQLLSPIHVDYVMAAIYPPTFVIFFQCLAPFSASNAYLFWTLLSILVGTGMLWLVLKTRADLGFWGKIILLLLFMCSAPAVIALRLGQTTWFFVALICGLYLALHNQQRWPAGVLLALSTMKPQYAACFLIPPLIRRNWLVIASALLTECALLGLCIAKLSLKTVLSYPAVFKYSENNFDFLDSLVSLRSLYRRALSPEADLLATIICLLTGLALCGMLSIYAIKPSDVSRFRWAFGLIVLTALCVSPHSFIQDCFLIAIVASLTIPFVHPRNLLRPGSLLLKLYFLLLSVYPLVSWFGFIEASQTNGKMIVLIVHEWCILVLGAFIYFRNRKDIASIEE